MFRRLDQFIAYGRFVGIVVVACGPTPPRSTRAIPDGTERIEGWSNIQQGES